VLFEHVWELVQHNNAAIVDDFACGPGAGVSVGARIDPGVRLMNDRAIRLEEGVRLRPGVVLDAEEGPITLAAGVDVQPQVVVRGPAWIGPDCLLKAGGRIHAGTSIGPVSKVGGEIEASILQGYGNKQHEGFLGHAFLAEWVNLGADTNNSDLKNNYGSVRMWEAGEFVDTGRMFVGLVAADHVKSAINTQFNTGTVVGLSSQVFGTGFPPKYVPPFSWGTGGETYELERALDTARAVMARRERDLTRVYENAFRRAFARARPRR
jgi:UDP-N-acetylglucosamine diphosphorylase/glucosamine-1-phosphate N-acetyltransferase